MLLLLLYKCHLVASQHKITVQTTLFMFVFKNGTESIKAKACHSTTMSSFKKKKGSMHMNKYEVLKWKNKFILFAFKDQVHINQYLVKSMKKKFKLKSRMFYC